MNRETSHVTPPSAEREPVGTVKMAVAPGCREGRLGRPVADAAEHTPDGQARLAREVVGLIEPARERAKWVQRHRHHGIRVVQHRVASVAHEAAKRLGEQATLLKLERVHELPERAVVAAGTAGDGVRWRPAPAAPAEVIEDARPGELVAAARAQTRAEPGYRAPAGVADHVRQRAIEQACARGARRRQQQTNEIVGSVEHSHRPVVLQRGGQAAARNS